MCPAPAAGLTGSIRGGTRQRPRINRDAAQRQTARCGWGWGGCAGRERLGSRQGERGGERSRNQQGGTSCPAACLQPTTQTSARPAPLPSPQQQRSQLHDVAKGGVQEAADGVPKPSSQVLRHLAVAHHKGGSRGMVSGMEAAGDARALDWCAAGCVPSPPPPAALPPPPPPLPGRAPGG